VSETFLAQPEGGTVAQLLAETARTGSYEAFDASVAYATVGGVQTLQQSMPPTFNGLQKRWLVGIDWCRSQPEALDLLAGLEGSSVRIHDGLNISARPGCTPTLPFHPKGFLFTGTRSAALVVGSANLSRNGLSRGHEANLRLVARRATRRWDTISESKSWYDRLWRRSTPWATVRSAYLQRFQAFSNLRQPVPTDDDAIDTSILGRHSFSSPDLTKLRACQQFWIEAGNLHANRGAGVPGNQLMLRSLSRVFFGFPPLDLPRDSAIGSITITYAGIHYSGRTLRHSNNAMDVLSLPVPGQGAPARYDGETLHFRRQTRAHSTVFDLTIGAQAERTRWRQRSQAVGGLFAMRGSRREFGVY
jgi:HKD family nuclease